MTPAEAADFLRPAFTEPPAGRWADLGAGTGVFTLALRQLMASGEILAVDKNPHALWSLPLRDEIPISVVEADFTQPLDLPLLDGLILANALHYAAQPERVLQHIGACLRPGATLLLIEYDTGRPLPPWIPYPILPERAADLLKANGFDAVRSFNRRPSRYGPHDIYGLVAARSLNPV